MLREKIKGLLYLRGLRPSHYADRLGIKEPSLSRKFKDEAFSIKDLLALADLTNSSLCLVDNAGNSVLVNFSQ